MRNRRTYSTKYFVPLSCPATVPRFAVERGIAMSGHCSFCASATRIWSRVMYFSFEHRLQHDVSPAVRLGESGLALERICRLRRADQPREERGLGEPQRLDVVAEPGA